MRIVTNTSTCEECKPDFKVSSGSCVAATASDTGYYSSNSKVCPEYFHYNKDKDRCIRNKDKNCKETDDNITCLTCSDNFVPSNFYEKLTVTHLAGERDGCLE